MLAKFMNMALPGSWSDTLCCTDRDKETAANAAKVAGKEPIFPQPKGADPAAAAASLSAAAPVPETAPAPAAEYRDEAPALADDAFLTGGGRPAPELATFTGDGPEAEDPGATASARSSVHEEEGELDATQLAVAAAGGPGTTEGMLVLKSMAERVRPDENAEEKESTVSSDSSLEKGLTECRADVKLQLKSQQQSMQQERERGGGRHDAGAEVLGQITTMIHEIDGKAPPPAGATTGDRPSITSQGSFSGTRELSPRGQYAYRKTMTRTSVGSDSSIGSRAGANVGDEQADAAEEGDPPRISTIGLGQGDEIRELWENTKHQLEHRTIFGSNMDLRNDEDARADRDICGTGLYHCGRRISPDSEERCGPPNGRQCASCMRLENLMRDQQMGAADIKVFQERMRNRLQAIDAEEGELPETLDPAEAVKMAVLRHHEKCVETSMRPMAGSAARDLGEDETVHLNKMLERLRDTGMEPPPKEEMED